MTRYIDHRSLTIAFVADSGRVFLHDETHEIWTTALKEPATQHELPGWDTELRIFNLTGEPGAILPPPGPVREQLRAGIAIAIAKLTGAPVICASQGSEPPGYPTPTKYEDLMLDKDGWVTGVIEMNLDEFINNDLEDVLDIMSERLTRTLLLCDISYKVVGFKDDTTLLLEVSGDGNMIDTEDDSEEAEGGLATANFTDLYPPSK